MHDMQIASASEKKKPSTYNLSIWANCKIVGDPAIDADDVLLLGALQQINEIIEVAESSIKKL
jgi:metal-sulfur cluster biosynthetic enzyme